MKGLVLDGKLQLRDDLPQRKPGPGEALIRVRLAGICATDLQMLRGYHPFSGVLGHEFVGEVVDAPGAQDWVGRRVVGDINVGCGACAQCRAGRAKHCDYRRVIGIRGQDGAFAESLVLPTANLHRVADGIADEAAVFAEPLAAALAVPEQTRLRPTERVLLVGAGRLGQLLARVLRLSGCDLAVVARHPRQQVLLDQTGIARIGEAEVDERGYDLVVDGGGSADSFALARRAVRPGGRIVLKSTYRGLSEVDLSALVVDEIRLIGSRCGPFAPALRLLQGGLVDPTPLIDAVYPLDQGPAAMLKAAQPGVLKVLLDLR